jgi:hypothetical protein
LDKRNLKWMLIMLGTIVLLLALLLSFSKKSIDTTPEAATKTINIPIVTPTNAPINIEKLITYEDANTWPMVKDGFSTESSEPQVIYLSQDKLLYVQNNQLYHLNFGKQPVSLRQWESPRLAKIWKLGEGFLIGSKEGDTAEWQYVRPLKSAEESFEYSLLSGLTSGPEQVLEIKYSAAPELALLTFDELVNENTLNRNEYIFTPHNLRIELVSLELNPGQGQERENTYYSHELIKKKDVSSIEPTSKWANNTYTFEDNRGTILYSRDKEISAIRYGDLQIIDTKTFPYEGFPAVEYVHLKDPQNKEFIAGIGQRFYPFVEAMWESDWTQLLPNVFYHLDAKALKTVRFEPDSSYTSFTAISNEYELAGLIFIEKLDDWLTFEKNGKQLYLSLEDAAWQDSRSSKTDPAIASLLMSELPQPQTTEGAKDFPGNPEETKVTVELPESIQDRYNTDSIPAKLTKVVEEIFYSGSGDANVSSLYRKIGNEWYILVDSQLYLFEKDEIVLLGIVPTQTMTWMVNYSINFGAEDFTKLKDNWYFADTIGNRLIKLDEKLNLIKELALPAPSAIQSLNNGKLEITSLQGKTEVNSELTVLKTSKPKPNIIPDKQMVTTDISGYDIQPSSYYVDPVTKLTWYYRSPYLNLYQTKTNELSSLYVGPLNNGYGSVRIIPYRDQIILLFDNRALFFQRDGTYVKTIEFPRDVQPAMYDMTTEGENSFYYAEKQNKLYLVQGFRIIAIDLLTNEVTTVFKQNYSNLRKIVYDSGKLYFALQTSIEQKFDNYSSDKPKESYTEICEIELKTNQLKRYRMAGNWTIDEIEKGQLILIDKKNDSDTIKSFYFSIENIY